MTRENTMTTVAHRPLPIALIADDDVTVRMLARQVLEQAGLSVEEVEDGEQAVAAFKRTTPDIVLLDVMMPKMTGFEACHAIRHLPGGSHTPILIMTGLDDVESIEQAYDVGATDFIAKPWQVLILSNRIRYMLRASRMVEALRESQLNLARAQKLAHLGSWAWHVTSNHLTVSEEVYRILGVSLGHFSNTREGYVAFVHPEDLDMVTRSIQDALDSQRTYQLDYRIVRPDGAERIVSEHGEPILGDGGLTTSITGTIQDITDRRNAETQLFLSTYYDPLTHLPNRQLFTDRLAKAIGGAHTASTVGGLLLLNVDQFHRINDTFGMTRGDEVLLGIGERLQDCVRKGDAVARGGPDESASTLARLVGDTFAIFLPHLQSDRDAAKVARRLLSAIHRPFMIGEEQVTVKASVGITLFPTDGSDVDTLVKNSEAALQSAKRKGGDTFEYYVVDMHAGSADQRELEAEFRRALEQQELALYYQPQVDVRRWAITGVEAFVRWPHPTRGFVPPNVFVPLAENVGLGVTLGEWVIRAACAQQKAWRDAGAPGIRVSVNLSDYHFGQQSLIEIICAAVQDVGPSPDFLEMEVTEGAIMRDLAHSLKLLKRLKSLGVRIAVDDFGAGSSSVRELSRLPIDTVKIAPVFVQESSQQGLQSGIAAAVIGLGHGLKCRVVAKNVETQEQLEALRRLGCDDIQGHLYGAAQPADRIAQLLQGKPLGSQRGLSAA